MKDLKPLAITGAILLLIAITGSIFLPTKLTSLLNIAFAILLYFVAPGYCILLHLPLKPHERIIIGTAVSSALVPLILYTLDIVGIPLSRTTIVITIITICGISYAIYTWKN